MQKAEYGQGLISNAYYGKIAAVGSDHFEQSHDRPHTRTVNQAERRKVDEYAGRLFFANPAYGWSEVDDRECIKLTFNAKDRGAILLVEIEEHRFSIVINRENTLARLGHKFASII